MNGTKSEYLELYQNIMDSKESTKIEYTISDNYVKDLNMVFGIKEFIANFYDANGSDFNMDFSNKSLILKDNNKGINIKYMVIGNSGSREDIDKIGEHGEGFKIGALTIVRNGFKVLFETVGYTIAFGMEYSEVLKTNVLFAKFITNNIKEGTTVFLECKKSDFMKAKNMFLLLSDYQKINENIIIHPLRNKDIYLNGLSHMKSLSLFSYNIKEKNQVSNRDRNFINQEVLEKHLISIYNNLNDSFEIQCIIEEFLNSGKSFDKMLESKIVDRLSLEDYQKEMFRNCLSAYDYYTNNISLLDSEFIQGKNVIEVSDKLFLFLTYINANVLLPKNQDIDFIENYSDNVIKSFVVDKSIIANIESIEMYTSTLLCENLDSSFYNNIANYSLYEICDISEEEFMSFLNEYTLNQRLYKKIDKDPLKRLINNLILLSCIPDINVKILIEDSIFSIETHFNENYFVLFRKYKCDDYNSFSINIERTNKYDWLYKKEQETYLYINNLKYKRINSLYSYLLKSTSSNEIKSDFYRLMELHLNEVIIRENQEFLNGLLSHIEVGLYEYDYLPKLNNSTKQLLLKIFEENYSNYCLPYYKEEYNKIVQEKYSYKLITSDNKNIINFLKRYDIKDSFQVFSEKQYINIDTIEYNEVMDKAVSIFKRCYDNPEIVIQLAIYLPQRKESCNKNGIVYISNDCSDIPEYIAALIGYEYEQVKNQYTTPSHKLQSVLTHHILDKIELV